ncbi:DUF1028 domain-containing protein [Modicisalibacter coralii]|uniref:DUF1028 domain-containing protein n=1 Tax=Modicisalibacter coralii TaxID=2304602 RepID=UPI00100B2BB6|nr:DUF1028 domain-containing protein [Halomonas coralii]
MTLSLLHVDPASGTAAALTATGGVAVGGYVHHAWRGLGACATQGLYTNPWYPDGVRRALETGATASDALDGVVSADDGADCRQCLVMDARGRAALHSGTGNHPVVAGVCYPGLAAAGNLLAGPGVIDALLRRFLERTCDDPDAVIENATAPRYRDGYQTTLLETLIDALEAALAAGGDVRGTRSAALRIESFHAAPIDLRVDWAEPDPIDALRALAARVRDPDFGRFLDALPQR